MSEHEYRNILKTSAITGSARVVTILASFLRAKLIAVYVGPAGLGLLGLYTSSLAIISSLASLGIDSSGVRQVAANANDAISVGNTVTALRRVCWVTGAFAATLCAALSGWISELTFGDRNQAPAIAALSVSVFFGQVTLGQSALLRGLRQIRQLAIQSVITAVFSLVTAFACLVTLRERGIVPMMLTTSLITIAGTWWYARRVSIVPTKQTLTETLKIAQPLVILGFAFMISGLFAAVGTHLIGIMVHNIGGAQANGFYQAAWAISGSLTSLLLSGMAQDFYPRLTEIAHNDAGSSEVINRQIEVGMLTSLPALCLLSSLAPYVVTLFFSREFIPAAEAIPWFAVGCFGRAISWPMAYLLLARGLGKLFALSEFLSVVLHVSLAYWLINKIGLEGSAQAFAILYVIYSLTMYTISKRLTARHLPNSLLSLAVAGYVILVALVWLPLWATVSVSIIISIYTLIRLRRLTNW